MASVEFEIGAADKYLDKAKPAAGDQPWTVDQFLAAAQVQALLALARAVDGLADDARR